MTTCLPVISIFIGFPSRQKIKLILGTKERRGIDRQRALEAMISA
jgi:hypothetical protein